MKNAQKRGSCNVIRIVFSMSIEPPSSSSSSVSIWLAQSQQRNRFYYFCGTRTANRNLIWTINRQTSRIPICVFAPGAGWRSNCITPTLSAAKISSFPRLLLMMGARTSPRRYYCRNWCKSTKTLCAARHEFSTFHLKYAMAAAWVGFFLWGEGPLRGVDWNFVSFHMSRQQLCGLGKIRANVEWHRRKLMDTQNIFVYIPAEILLL